jgi:excisionase family DNA binding protein
MKTIFIQLSEEELQEQIMIAVQKALEKFTPKNHEVAYITRKEAAALLHVSLPTLHEYTKTGKLKSLRIHGRVLYSREDIDSALTSVETLKYRRG